MPKRIITDEVIKIWDDNEVSELMNKAKTETDEAIDFLRGELEEKTREIQDLRTQTHDTINTVRTELEKRAEERIKKIREEADKEVLEANELVNEFAETGKKAVGESKEKDEEIAKLKKSITALKSVNTKLKKRIDKKNEQ